MITRQSIAPLVQNFVALDDKGSTQSQYTLRNLSEFHVLGDGRDFADRTSISQPLSETQIGRLHFDLLGRFGIRVGEFLKADRLVGSKVVIVDEHVVAINGGILFQKGFQFFRVADTDKDGSIDVVVRQLVLDALPLIGVRPAVGSSHVSQKDYNTCIKYFFGNRCTDHRVSERDFLAIDVCDNGVAEWCCVRKHHFFEVGWHIAWLL